MGGKYWKEEPTERAVKKLIRGVRFVKKDGLKKGRQAYVLVRDETAPQVKEAAHDQLSLFSSDLCPAAS